MTTMRLSDGALMGVVISYLTWPLEPLRGAHVDKGYLLTA